MQTDQEEDCFLTLWMVTKHILWPGDVKCDFFIPLDKPCRRCLFSLQEKECQSLQVILKMELQELVRNELGNIKGGRGKMHENENETKYITCFSGIKAGKMRLSEREEAVHHCNHLFSEEKFFQFVYQAGRLLPTSKERSFDVHPSHRTCQISGRTVGNERFFY